MASTKKTDSTWRQVVKSLGTDRQKLHELAEKICLDVSESNREFEIDERHVFEQLGWDADDIQRQVARLSKVQTLKEIAGSKKQIESLKQKVQAQKEKVEPQIAELMSEIEDREKRVDTLRKSISNNLRQLDQKITAADSLRSLAPRFCRDARNAELRAIKQSNLAIKFREVESRLGMIEVILDRFVDVSCENQNAIIGHCKNYVPDRYKLLVRQIKNSMGIAEKIDTVEWARYVNELRNERTELQDKFDKLKPRYDQAIGDCDRHLDYYLQTR